MQIFRLSLVLILLGSPLAASAADTGAGAVKWIDEKGRVHFGDRPPADHRGETETIELREAPKLGLTPEELAEQRQRVNDYRAKIELEAAERELNSSQESEREATRKPSTGSGPTLEECKQLHTSRTKDRVECFRGTGKEGDT